MEEIKPIPMSSAAETNTRRPVSGILVKVSGMVLAWTSARQATVTHSSTESDYISANTGARILVWLASLANKVKNFDEAKNYVENR